MRTVAIIPARVGSKGIPGKNFRPLAGYPLVGWVAAAAKQAKTLDAIYVSTDAPERAVKAIAPAIQGFDGGAPLSVWSRDAALAQDDTPDLPVFQDVLTWLGGMGADDLIVHLRPTSPFVRPEDIDGVVALATRFDLPMASVRSVVPAPAHPAKMYAERIPLIPEVPCLAPVLGQAAHRANHPRQGLSPTWLAAGYVDAVRVWTVRAGGMDGWPILAWPVPAERAIDLDTEADWLRAERLALERGWRPGQVD